MAPFMNTILICLLTVVPSVCLTKNEKVFFSCDFGTRTDETFCGMQQSVDDDFDWKLTSTSGKSNTGPMVDHTGNLNGTGRFLWSDSDDGSGGQKATTATPTFNLTGDQAFVTYWLHLYGNGRLEIAVCQGGEIVLTLDGDQGNQWYQQNMTISCGDLPLQIAFTATRISEEADVGIDDIYIFDIPMATPAATSPEPVSTSSSLISSISSALSPHPVTSRSDIPSSHIATSTETTFQSPSSSPSSSSESYRGMAIGFGVVSLFLLLFGVVITLLYIKIRFAYSKNKLQQQERPYMDLVPSSTPTEAYETMGTRSVSKVGDGSYGNQSIVAQHQHMNEKLTTGDGYEYALPV